MNPGDLMLPRFKVEWQSKLNEALQALGMAEAFDSSRADFSQMAKVKPGELFIPKLNKRVGAK